MNLEEYNEKLAILFHQMSDLHRIAFLTKCGEKLSPHYLEFAKQEPDFANAELLQECINGITTFLVGNCSQTKHLEELLNNLDPLVPEADDFPDEIIARQSSHLIFSSLQSCITKVLTVPDTCAYAIDTLSAIVLYVECREFPDRDTRLNKEQENGVWNDPLVIKEINDQQRYINLLLCTPVLTKIFLQEFPL